MQIINKSTLAPILTSLGYEVVPEFQFCKDRKFRADWKVSKGGEVVLIEYEGIYVGNGKSRHTTVNGYTGDTEKYNLATVLGFRTLRYTAKNFNNIIDDLEEVLK
jgi:hypothetical protein